MLNEKQKQYDHDMICHDICHDGINNPIICHDSNEMYEKNVQLKEEENRLNKSDWYYLVQTLESWRVFNPRAIVKKNPAAAWRCMNICKDRNVRVPGAYFTACFRTELAKEKAHQNFVNLLEKKCGVA